jgi:hypothetical protein
MSDPRTIPLPADVEDDLRCPLCDYNLRGLAEPRCPECGYRFAWDAIRAQARERREFFFEHDHRDRARAFLRTALRALLPRRFWRHLQPAVPYSARLLGVYASVVPVVASLPLLVLVVRQNRSIPGYTDIRVWGLLDGLLADSTMVNLLVGWPLAELLGTVDSAVARTLLPALLWPAATYVVLNVFQVSMARARIKPVHVLRCVTYSADALLWAGLLVTLVTILASVPIARGGESNGIAAVVAVVAYVVTIPVFVYRLMLAYRLYLQFDHPRATVLVVQFIVALAFTIAVLWYAYG